LTAISINAKVITPQLNDSAIVQINPLENVTLKVQEVMDLLQAHPECLELNELVTNAKLAIANQEYTKANNLLEEALRSCRFILTKEEEVKAEEKSPKKNILIWIILGLIVFAATLSFFLTRRLRSKRYKNRKASRENKNRNKGGL